jgi:ATP-dependent DNA helicase
MTPGGGGGQRLQWMKISDPDRPVPHLEPGAEVRVLLPAGAAFDPVAEKLAGAGVAVRRVRHLLEDETIEQAPGAGPVARCADCHLSRPGWRRATPTRGAAALAARDAFDQMWQAHAAGDGREQPATPIEALVAADWVRYFPHPSLNPAQAQALPEVLNSEENLLVVAPTGAGKTVIGMAAALRTIRQGRKSAWLVPQRSLTDELDRDLETWRRQGLRVERLSGEHTVDAERIRRADLWVSTTEKFEAICRASALRGALAEVGSLVIDEVHLLGDPARGPVLEALLARARDAPSPTRLVGLSATVSNGDEIAGWLRARLLRIGWRPNRLTWQLLQVPGHADWNVTDASRTRLAAAVTARVAAGGGSVLVFCGSKRTVRRMALVIAATRGADVYRVHPEDVERVHQVCHRAGVGLHYKGWEYRREAEAGFREHSLDVLVATSTVAAGVNLPARAVVVRDSQLGLDGADVATVQQMFGRAGRIGAGEPEGWAFLLVDPQERAGWQARLTAGHTVRSQILSSLPEHILGEAVQQRIRSRPEAERWWVQTLAHHQGRRDPAPLRGGLRFLVSAGLLDRVPGAHPEELRPTELGRLTARMMVSPEVGHALREALGRAPVPDGPHQAERLLITVLARQVPKLAQATVGEEARAAVARVLATHGPVPGETPGGPLEPGQAPGDLARAALLSVATSPRAFGRGVRAVAGIPYPAIYPILEEAPRYLHWIGSQGLLGTVHPWCAVVAADLGRRVRWRRLAPGRGAGRLLWMCEQMATPVHAEQAVPALWEAATGRGYAAPDWPAGRAPQDCRLDEAEYQVLLRERGTGCAIRERGGTLQVSGPAGSTLVTWSAAGYQATTARRGTATAAVPAGPLPTGAVLFTWRGDHLATGWLAGYRSATPVTG